jgi:hypothetical protein
LRKQATKSLRVVGCPEKRGEDHQKNGAADHSGCDDYRGRQAH